MQYIFMSICYNIDTWLRSYNQLTSNKLVQYCTLSIYIRMHSAALTREPDKIYDILSSLICSKVMVV